MILGGFTEQTKWKTEGDYLYNYSKAGRQRKRYHQKRRPIVACSVVWLTLSGRDWRQGHNRQRIWTPPQKKSAAWVLVTLHCTYVYVGLRGEEHIGAQPPTWKLQSHCIELPPKKYPNFGGFWASKKRDKILWLKRGVPKGGRKNRYGKKNSGGLGCKG